jgi:predicted PilT family ATPase
LEIKISLPSKSRYLRSKFHYPSIRCRLTKIGRFHEKVRKFVGREQQSDPPSSFPVRVSFGEPGSKRQTTRAAEPNAESSAANDAFLRGPGANVDDLRAKILAFIEEAERDDLERGYTTVFEFPSKFNNYLIGKRGANINELRERFDVDINTTDDGKVVIKGPKAKADACKAHIISMGKKWEDEATFNLKIEPKFHRDLIGRQGEGVNRLQEKYNVRIQFPRSNNISDDQSVADTSSEVGTPRHARPNQSPDEVIIRGPRQGADKARSDLLELYQYYKDNSHTATVSVAQKQIPSLMGRGGTEMDRLRAETNAHIEVPSVQDAKDSSGRVEIRIKGPKQAVEAARIELQKRAKTFDDIVTKTIEVDKKHHQALIGGGGKFYPFENLAMKMLM